MDRGNKIRATENGRVIKDAHEVVACKNYRQRYEDMSGQILRYANSAVGKWVSGSYGTPSAG